MINTNSTIENAQHIDAAGSNSTKRKIVPHIPYKRPAPTILSKDEYMTSKLHTVPNQADSPTFELTVPFFQYQNGRRMDTCTSEDQESTRRLKRHEWSYQI